MDWNCKYKQTVTSPRVKGVVGDAVLNLRRTASVVLSEFAFAYTESEIERKQNLKKNRRV